MISANVLGAKIFVIDTEYLETGSLYLTKIDFLKNLKIDFQAI